VDAAQVDDLQVVPGLSAFQQFVGLRTGCLAWATGDHRAVPRGRSPAEYPWTRSDGAPAGSCTQWRTSTLTLRRACFGQ